MTEDLVSSYSYADQTPNRGSGEAEIKPMAIFSSAATPSAPPAASLSLFANNAATITSPAAPSAAGAPAHAAVPASGTVPAAAGRQDVRLMTAAAFNALEDKGGHTDNRAPMYERRNDGFIPVRRRPSADMRAAARPPMQTVQPDVRGTAIKGGDGVHNFQPWIATANFT